MKSEEYVYRRYIENKVETRIDFPGRKRFPKNTYDIEFKDICTLLQTCQSHFLN